VQVIVVPTVPGAEHATKDVVAVTQALSQQRQKPCVERGHVITAFASMPMPSNPHLKWLPKSWGNAVGQRLDLGRRAKIEPDQIERVTQRVLAQEPAAITSGPAAERPKVLDEARLPAINLACGLGGELFEARQPFAKCGIDQQRARVAKSGSSIADHRFWSHVMRSPGASQRSMSSSG
jgi:hypothetical protein